MTDVPTQEKNLADVAIYSRGREHFRPLTYTMPINYMYVCMYIYIYIYMCVVCVCVCACAHGRVWFEICLTKISSYLKVRGKETLRMSGDISLRSPLY